MEWIILFLAVAFFGLRWFINKYKDRGIASTVPRQNLQPIQAIQPSPVFSPPITASPTEQTHQDAWEGNFWESTEVFTVKAVLDINYTDRNGNNTQRIIEVRRVGTKENDALIDAFCRLRNQSRTFYISRINSCTDVETGEAISDVLSILREHYDTSPDRTLERLLNDEYDVLRILLYIAKADGRFTAKEKAIVRETCRTLSNDSRLTDESIDKTFAERGIPSIQAFKMAVGRIAKRKDRSIDTVIQAAETMIATDGTIHHAETEALDYIHKRKAEHA